MKQWTILLLSLLCSAALAAGSKHAGRPSGKASYLAGTGKTLPHAALDSGWAPITLLVHDNDSDRICQACAYDPVHDKLYVYGGTPNGVSGSWLPWLDRYDPLRDTWEPMADMSVPRAWIKGLYCRGKLYALGGAQGLTFLDTCEAYNIATNTWSPIRSMPEARAFYASVCWRDSLIYLIGGGQWAGTGDIRIYDPFRDTWMAPTEQAPDSLYMDDACIIGDTIYVAGSSDRSSMMKGGIDPANPRQINWSSGPALPCGDRYLGPTLALAGKVYFFGGYTQAVTREGWVYNPGNGAFDTLPLLPAATGTGTIRCCFGVVRDPAGEIYKLAGDDNGDWSPPNRTYFRLRINIPHHPDVGVARILTPAAVIDSGDTVVPSAVVRNYGDAAAGFRVMFRINDGYVRFDSAYLGVGDSALVDFSPWVADHQGTYVAKCSTMLAGDSNPGNDMLHDSFTVRAFDAEVGDLNLPDTLVADTFVPRATVWNRWPRAGSVEVTCSMCHDSEQSVYARSESIYLAVGDSRPVAFPAWNVSSGWYQAKVFVTHGGVVLRDTTRQDFQAYGFEATIANLYLPDTIPFGSFTPLATVMNSGQLAGWTSVPWRIFRDDTLPVFDQVESTYLTPGANRQIAFPSWDAAVGSYLAKVFAIHKGRVLGDTTQKHFWVKTDGVAGPDNEPLPRAFALDITSSNPSRDAVTIRYALPQAADISLKLYDAAGKLRAILDQGRKAAGRYNARFEIRDSRFDITPGIYFVRLNSPGFQRTRKVVITQ